MKKVILVLMVLAFGITSCDRKAEFVNEESLIVDVAGEWYVQYDHEVYGEDPFGVGHTELLTFNTAANDFTMWMSDEESFWDYKVKVEVDLDSKTFSGEGKSAVPGYDIMVRIQNGQIFPDAVLMPSGAVTDSIYYEVWFEDLEDATGIADDKLIVHGYRHTGFTEDSAH